MQRNAISFHRLIAHKPHSLFLNISANAIIQVDDVEASKRRVKEPTLKEIINLLCHLIREEDKPVSSKDGKTIANITHLVCRCSHREYCSNKHLGSKIFISKKRGFPMALVI